MPLTQYSGHHLSFLLSSSLFIPLPPSLPSTLYLSAIRQIGASLICIVSSAVPTGAPRSCSLKDSGATAPSRSPIPWIKVTLGQHQHIMNYGHLPLQTHCSLCSNVGNIERDLADSTCWQLILSLISSVVRAPPRVDGWPALRCWPPDLYPEFKAFTQTWAWFRPRWGQLVTLVILGESQGRVISGNLGWALPGCVKPLTVTFLNVRFDLAKALIQIQTRPASGCPELFNQP